MLIINNNCMVLWKCEVANSSGIAGNTTSLKFELFINVYFIIKKYIKCTKSGKQKKYKYSSNLFIMTEEGEHGCHLQSCQK